MNFCSKIDRDTNKMEVLILENLSEDMFRRRNNVSGVRRTGYNVPQEQKNRIVNSWDDFFSAIFQGKTFSDIQRSRVYVKRTLPRLHSQNKTGVELALPYQFGFDSNGERWFGVLYDLGKEQDDWKFLLFKPDRESYILYLAGMIELMQLFRTTNDFYLFRPEVMGNEGVLLHPVDLAPEMLPANGTFYNHHIIFDTNDLFFGGNTADVDKIIEYARRGEFY